jgi:hypothetical protein
MKTEEKGISTAAIVGIVVTVVVVAVVGGVAAVVLLQPGGGGGGGQTMTTTPGGGIAGTTTTTPGGGGGGGTTTTTHGGGGTTTTTHGGGGTTTTTHGGGVGGATSLTCTVDVTSENFSGTMMLKAKNIGTDELKIREEGTIQYMGTTQDIIYIINGEQRKAWMCTDGQWMDVSASFSTYWDELSGSFNESMGQMSGWTGGDITYTEPTTGYSYRIYDIVLNPVLDDSLFIGQGGETTTQITTITTTTTPGGGVGSVTSLQFTVDATTEGMTSTITYKAKNIGSSNMKLRLEGTIAGQDIVYIINGELQKFWMYSSGVWMDMSAYFSQYWDIWESAFVGYQADLSGWTGGTYTSPDGTVTIHDIILNPVLDDSLFIHTE